MRSVARGGAAVRLRSMHAARRVHGSGDELRSKGGAPCRRRAALRRGFAANRLRFAFRRRLGARKATVMRSAFGGNGCVVLHLSTANAGGLAGNRRRARSSPHPCGGAPPSRSSALTIPSSAGRPDPTPGRSPEGGRANRSCGVSGLAPRRRSGAVPPLTGACAASAGAGRPRRRAAPNPRKSDRDASRFRTRRRGCVGRGAACGRTARAQVRRRARFGARGAFR